MISTTTNQYLILSFHESGQQKGHPIQSRIQIKYVQRNGVGLKARRTS